MSNSQYCASCVSRRAHVKTEVPLICNDISRQNAKANSLCKKRLKLQWRKSFKTAFEVNYPKWNYMQILYKSLIKHPFQSLPISHSNEFCTFFSPTHTETHEKVKKRTQFFLSWH